MSENHNRFRDMVCTDGVTITVAISELNEKAIRIITQTPKGYRNAEVLRRDGYLSPENMER